MRKTLSILFLLAVALCGQASAQLSQCAITATIYDNNGDLLSGARIVVVKVVKNGSLISNSPLVYTTNASGVATFNLPRSSVAWIWANSYGLNANGSAGVAVTVPAAASANLEELAAFSSVLTTLGDLAYGGASGVFTRLAGNTSSTAKFLCQQGNGTTSTAPGWCAFAGSGNLTLTYDNNARTATFGYAPSSSELLAAFGSQSANTVLAGPTTGSVASPTFRALVAADIPDLSATYQPLDPDLTTIGGLSPSNDDILQRKAGAWTNRTIAQLKTDLNYATVATSGSASDLSTGTVPDARFPATLPALSGANLTALNANNIASGSLALARIAQGGATSSQVLAWNGSAWAPATAAGGTTINSTDGTYPYRVDATTFGNGALRHVDSSTVEVAALNGGNTSGGTLTLRGTSNGTPGSVLLNPSGGNLSLGLNAATNPAVDFVVGTGDGTINESGGFRLRSTNVNGNSRVLQFGINHSGIGGANSGYGYIQFGYWGGTQDNPIILQPKAGAVIIGDMVPIHDWKLGVRESIAIMAPNNNANGELGGRLAFPSSGYAGETAYIASVKDKSSFPAGTGLVFATNAGADVSSSDGIERVRISSEGFVGINSTSPAAQLDVRPSSASTIGQIIRLASGQTANALNIENSTGTLLSGVLASGAFYSAGIAFASLGTPSNGTFIYCTDCTIASPCASGGTGALAKRLNSVWVCN